MRGKMSADMGEIIIDKDVLAKYAGAATTECIGIVGMASVNVKDGVTKLLKRESAGRGVNISIVDNKIKIELHIIVAYGVSIRAVSQNVIENVKYKIEEFTGMDVESINVIVEGVRIIDGIKQVQGGTESGFKINRCSDDTENVFVWCKSIRSKERVYK